MAKIMKDGKPSTSFSRQDREWVKSMRGGDTPTGTITITENGEYDVTNYATADVQVESGSSDFGTATITLNLTPPEGVTLTLYDLGDVKVPFCGVFYAPNGGILSSENNTITVPLGKDEDRTLKFGFGYFVGNDDESLLYTPDGTVTLSGAIEEITAGDSPYYLVTGDCSITCNVVLD